MKIEKFKEKAENLLGKLEDLICTMPQKGNKSTDCQRVYLQQKINEVYHAVNGTEQKDLEAEFEDLE